MTEGSPHRGRATTLNARLVLTSSAWVLLALVVAGTVLVWLFRDHIERRFDASLDDQLRELVAASDAGADGRVALAWKPFDPRFNRPRSGWYWQLSQDGDVMIRSDSLWQDSLPVEGSAAIGRRTVHLRGPAGEPLRALVQTLTLPRSRSTFTYVVAGPVSDIDRDVRRFIGQIAVTLTLLAAGLLAAVIVQVRFGLRPLRELRAALAEIRAGRASRLPQRFPAEIAPMVDELNALLDHNVEMLARARMQAADLAHALKNPLTVIQNESRDLPDAPSRVVREQVKVMTSAIQRHLSRARAAGARAPGARTSVAAVLEDLGFSLERLYRERGLSIRIEDAAGAVFRGDAEDLEEMVGNLMDNACKWARSQVLVHARTRDGWLTVTVEDDGPGVPPHEYERVLSRGVRLDESAPGTGIGLAAVRDVASAYRGRIDLARSRLGGLCATLWLPAAA